jgi:hypothetical protein
MLLRVEMHHHFHEGKSETNEKLDAILKLLRESKTREVGIMATLEQVLADVTEETTLIGSLSTLTAGLKAQLDDVLAGINLPPVVQAKVDAIFAAAEANKAAVAAAITANTPAAPPA